jgi:hypothetical protein
MSSATGGQPRSPSSVETGPSFITEPSVIDVSSQCSMTGMSNICVYSSARRISSAVATGSPSSLIATQPPSTSSPISVRLSPRWPMLTAPIG